MKLVFQIELEFDSVNKARERAEVIHELLRAYVEGIVAGDAAIANFEVLEVVEDQYV
jgi:hypothetical protein